MTADESKTNADADIFTRLKETTGYLISQRHKAKDAESLAEMDAVISANIKVLNMAGAAQ